MEFVLKGIFDYAVSNGWIGENPVDRVTVPKIASDDDMVFLSAREVELLADEAEKIGKPVDVFCQVVIGQCGVSFPSEKAVGFSPVRNWPVIARVLLFHCIRA